MWPSPTAVLSSLLSSCHLWETNVYNSARSRLIQNPCISDLKRIQSPVTMVLSSFPSEIILHILYLPVASLTQLPLVSRVWNVFLLQYQTIIYRHAAFLHGFIDDNSAPFLSAELRKRHAARIFYNLNSWKDLCAIDFSVC